MTTKRTYHQRRTFPPDHNIREVARLLQETYKSTHLYQDQDQRWLAIAQICMDAAISLVEIDQDKAEVTP